MPSYVDTAVSTLMAFLPSLIAAVLLLIVGYIVARVVSGLVRGLLRRTSLDNRLAQSLGGTGLGSEGAIASVVFWLIMLFVLIGFFQTLQLAAVSTPLGLHVGGGARLRPTPARRGVAAAGGLGGRNGPQARRNRHSERDGHRPSPQPDDR